MKIALASCANLPDWEIDDQPLIDEFRESGVDISIPAWDQDIDWSIFDACLLRTTWDYTLRITEFRNWIDRVSQQTILLNNADIVHWNSDKRYLKDLSEKGVSIAPTVWLEESKDILTILKEKEWSKAFLKPIVGACAYDTLRFTESEARIAQRLLDKVLPTSGMMLQPYLERVETEGEFSAIYFAGELSHCVQKIPVSGDYRVQDDYGAFDQSIDPISGLIDLAEQSLAAIEEDWLYARVDALRMEDNTWVLNELEMIEPSLFFRHSKTAARQLAQATINKVNSL